MIESLSSQIAFTYTQYISPVFNCVCEETIKKIVSWKKNIRDDYAEYITQGHSVALGLAFTAAVLSIAILRSDIFFIALGGLACAVILIHDNIRAKMPKKTDELQVSLESVPEKTKKDDGLSIKLKEILSCSIL